MEILKVDCGTCRARGPACGDCAITALLGPIEQTVWLDGEEQAAIGAMAASGLLPPLRLSRPVVAVEPPRPDEPWARFAGFDAIP